MANRSILIEVAKVGYGHDPTFDAYAPDQPNMEQRIAYALRHDPIFREAELSEGIDPEKTPDPASLSGRRPGARQRVASEEKRGERSVHISRRPRVKL